MDGKKKKDFVVFFDVIGGIAWLWMDLFWMLQSISAFGKDWRNETAFCAALSILFNIVAFCYAGTVGQYAVVGATTAWVLACAAWMMNDLYNIERLAYVGPALIFFVCNGCLLVAFVKSRYAKEKWLSALGRFKRLRIKGS